MSYDDPGRDRPPALCGDRSGKTRDPIVGGTSANGPNVPRKTTAPMSASGGRPNAH